MLQYDYIKDHIDKTYYAEEYLEERIKLHDIIINLQTFV
jgi:hypothetical protein